MNLNELYELFLHHGTVTTDSRRCPKGSLFFALKGERFDGNQYASQALDAGAAYAIIDNPAYQSDRTVLVEDSLLALQQLAHRHRKALNIPVIGITGTSGKTTTKELIAAVLATKYTVLATEGNLNNQIGVPLTLLRMNHEHEIAVVEMGANHPGEIRELVRIASPNYGLITNVGCAHLAGFGSFEGVLHAKGELYDYIRHTKGKVFINQDNKDLMDLARGIEQVTYGQHEGAFAVGHVVKSDPLLTFDWKQQGKVHVVDTKLVGAYNLENVLAAVAIGRFLKVPAERISRAIASYEPTNHRSQYKVTANNTLIADAYNANPSSMKAALDNFISLSESPKAVILGDMLELGEDSDRYHADIVNILRSASLGKVYLCGRHFGNTAAGFPVFSSVDDLIAAIRKDNLKGYHILIKGSHGMGLEKVIDEL